MRCEPGALGSTREYKGDLFTLLSNWNQTLPQMQTRSSHPQCSMPCAPAADLASVLPTAAALPPPPPRCSWSCSTGSPPAAQPCMRTHLASQVTKHSRLVHTGESGAGILITHTRTLTSPSSISIHPSTGVSTSTMLLVSTPLVQSQPFHRHHEDLPMSRHSPEVGAQGGGHRLAAGQALRQLHAGVACSTNHA